MQQSCYIVQWFVYVTVNNDHYIYIWQYFYLIKILIRTLLFNAQTKCVLMSKRRGGNAPIQQPRPHFKRKNQRTTNPINEKNNIVYCSIFEAIYRKNVFILSYYVTFRSLNYNIPNTNVCKEFGSYYFQTTNRSVTYDIQGGL